MAKELSEGRIEAFEYLFNRYYTPLCAYARKYLKDRDAAEDAVCSLFLHLWESRATLVNVCSMESYLIVSIHNTCLNKIRETVSRNKRNEIFFKSIVPYQEQGASSEYIENKIEQDIISGIIKNVYSTLPDKCRKILILRRENGLSYKEIAEQLNISVGTVKTQLSRANNKIKKALKNYTFGFFI